MSVERYLNDRAIGDPRRACGVVPGAGDGAAGSGAHGVATHRPRLLPQGKLIPRWAFLFLHINEVAVVAATLGSIFSQHGEGDRRLVVADNCSDETAAIARKCGAEAVERTDLEYRGKGYALDFGVQRMQDDPLEVVIIIDADCQVHPGTIDRLAHFCVDTSCPVQALDLMLSPEGAGLKTRIAELAWVVKNQVRPLGYHRLGLPCQLMGTGMAFPLCFFGGPEEMAERACQKLNTERGSALACL